MNELINLNPDIPRTKIETIKILAYACADIAGLLNAYIFKNEKEAFVRAMNALVVIRAMGTKNVLASLIGDALHDIPPLTDEELQVLRKEI